MRCGVDGVLFTLVGLVDVSVDSRHVSIIPLVCVHRCNVRCVRMVVRIYVEGILYVGRLFFSGFTRLCMYCHSSRLEAGVERSTSPDGDGVCLRFTDVSGGFLLEQPQGSAPLSIPLAPSGRAAH